MLMDEETRRFFESMNRDPPPGMRAMMISMGTPGSDRWKLEDDCLFPSGPTSTLSLPHKRPREHDHVWKPSKSMWKPGLITIESSSHDIPESFIRSTYAPDHDLPSVQTLGVRVVQTDISSSNGGSVRTSHAARGRSLDSRIADSHPERPRDLISVPVRRTAARIAKSTPNATTRIPQIPSHSPKLAPPIRQSKRQLERKEKISRIEVLDPKTQEETFSSNGVEGHRTGGASISRQDFERLEGNRLLNDNLVELGLRFLHETLRERNPKLADDVHIFHPSFFSAISEDVSKCASYTKDFDIFEKQILVIPIYDVKELQRYLAIVLHPHNILASSSVSSLKGYSGIKAEPVDDADFGMRAGSSGITVLVFDPLNKPRLGNPTKITSGTTQDLGALLNNFLFKEARRLGKNSQVVPASPTCVQVKLPHQTGIDCALYVLHLVEIFIPNATSMTSKILTGENDRLRLNDLKTLWQTKLLSSIRERLKDHILNLNPQWRGP